MRRVMVAAVCAAMLMVVPAAHAAANGQLLAIAGSGSERLVALNPDGSGVRTLWDPGAGHDLSNPSWSPDGNAIVLDDNGRITVFDAVTGTVQALTPGPAEHFPAWSPDGTQIAYAGSTPAYPWSSAVFVMDRDGGDAHVIIQSRDERTHITGVAWSSDNTVAYALFGLYFYLFPSSSAHGNPLPFGILLVGPDWSPDGTKLAYTSIVNDTSEVRYWPADVSGGWRMRGMTSDPAWAPDGLHVVFKQVDAQGSELRTWVPGDGNTLGSIPGTDGLSEPDWQPCVAGVTVSCESPRPPALPPSGALSCPATTPMQLVAGKTIKVPVTCAASGTASVRQYVVVRGPAHGSVRPSGQSLLYHANSNYRGTDSFTLKAVDGGLESNVATVAVTVTPRPAAPKLRALAVLRLARHVRLRAKCDRACSVALRVSVRLSSGRVVHGKLVRARAAAGHTLTLRLARGSLPAHRRVVSARIVGTVKGPDGSRRFTLTLKR